MRTTARYSSIIKNSKELWPLFPAALFLLGFLIIVLIYLIGMSFSYTSGAETTFPTLEAFRKVFDNPGFKPALMYSTLFVIVGTPLELITGIFLAILLYKSFLGRNLVRSVFLVPLAIPTLVTATILFILFDFPGGHINHLLMGKYGVVPAIINSPINWRAEKWLALGVSLGGKVWRDLPISMMIIASGLNAIDPTLFDAAKTMGAGFRKRLFTIILPLILPSISAVVLLRSLEMWKEFIFPFVLAGRHNLLGTLIESLYNNWGKSNEASVVALVMVICIILSTLFFMFLMDFIRKRLMRGE